MRIDGLIRVNTIGEWFPVLGSAVCWGHALVVTDNQRIWNSKVACKHCQLARRKDAGMRQLISLYIIYTSAVPFPKHRLYIHQFNRQMDGLEYVSK